MFGGLFAALNDPQDAGRQGALRGTPYVNGEMFAESAAVHLTAVEARAALEAARYDWRGVDPTIFGSLMEGFIGAGRRWALGAHYTHEADIMKIVKPTISDPRDTAIKAAKTRKAAQRAARAALAPSVRVLDPACGSGNFLYLAYRELRGSGVRAQGADPYPRREYGLARAGRAVALLPAGQFARHSTSSRWW